VAIGVTTRSRLALFGALYLAQGVPWGFLTFALPWQLAGAGIGAAEIGSIMSLAWLPWLAKPFIGLAVDRLPLGRRGRRRGAIVVGELGMAATLLAMAPVVPRGALAALGALVLVHRLFAAAQDVGTDALALDLLPAEERGRANGVMTAARVAGAALGGPGLLFLAGKTSWPATCLAAALLVLLPAAPVLLGANPESRTAPPRDLAAIRPGRELLRSFGSRAALMGVAFAAIAGASAAFLQPLQSPLYRTQLALSDAAMSTLGTLSSLAAVAGALLGGALADRLGRRRLYLLSTVALAAAELAFAAARPLWPHLPVLAAFHVAGGVLAAMSATGQVALFMDLANPAVGASSFQVYASLASARGFAAELVGGRVAAAVAPGAMFALGGLLELAPLPLLLLLGPARRAGDPSRAPAPPS
jgi:PAT family beta-lactamase induction signal transducer AmpG